MNKMYKHTYKKILPILLVISIIISLIFSFFMWIDPFQLGYFHKKQEIVNNSGIVSRSINEIFKPTQVVETDNNGNMKVYTNLQTNLTSEIVNDIKSWKMSNLRQISHNNKQTYQSILQQKNTIQLYYPDNIGNDIFNKTYHQHLMMSSHVTFSKIVFSQKKSNCIYLLNDNKYQVYKVSLNKEQTKNISKILKNHKTYEISPIIKKSGVLFVSKEPFSIPQYSYLVSNQTVNTVLNSLFSSSGNINTHHNGQYDYYYSGNKHVSVNNSNNNVNFENNESNGYKKNNLNHNLMSSYLSLNNKGLFQGVVHYFGNNNNGKKIDYRYFIYNIPIFDSNYGNINLVNMGNNQKISFSLTDLQVPLRIENNSVLPSSQTILDSLINKGIKLNNINQLIVGYKWITENNKKQIITLKPQWFVMINHKWHTYKDLIK